MLLCQFKPSPTDVKKANRQNESIQGPENTIYFWLLLFIHVVWIQQSGLLLSVKFMLKRYLIGKWYTFLCLMLGIKFFCVPRISWGEWSKKKQQKKTAVNFRYTVLISLPDSPCVDMMQRPASNVDIGQACLGRIPVMWDDMSASWRHWVGKRLLLR